MQKPFSKGHPKMLHKYPTTRSSDMQKPCRAVQPALYKGQDNFLVGLGGLHYPNSLLCSSRAQCVISVLQGMASAWCAEASSTLLLGPFLTAAVVGATF